MPRVCHVASGDLWAGAEVQVFTLLEFLRRQPGVEVSAILLHDRELARRLRGLGLDVAVIDQTRLALPRLVYGLFEALRARRPDVVHAHRYKETILGTMAARALGIRAVVSTVHGFPSEEGYRGLARYKMQLNLWLERRVTDRHHRTVVAVSQDMAAALRRRLRVPVALIPNGVPLPDGDPGGALPERGAVRAALGLDAADVVLGTAGRLVPVKGLDTLLAAMGEVVAVAPRARLVILGDGPLMSALRGRASALGLDGRVRFAGHVPDVRPYLRAMDVFVLPSYAEGLPMALLEAMAAALPVVATAVGGVPEVVRDGGEGLLVPPGAPAALAGALLRLVADPDSRAAMGARGRARVAEAFSIEATGPLYVALYRELAGGARAAA
jgi:glycosyltransferase involved in cell wall biosynthesis